MLPIHRTKTISHDKHIRYEIMNGSIHIRMGRRGEREPVLAVCTEGSL